MTSPEEFPIPRNEELEEIVISTLLMNFEAVPICMPILSEECFYNKYRPVFQAIKKDYEDNGEVDVNRVKSQLDAEGSPVHLSSLFTMQTGVDKAEEYSNRLKGLSAKRDGREGSINLLRDIDILSPQEFFTGLENVAHKNVDAIKIPGMTYSEIKARDEMKEEAEQLYTGVKFFDHVFFKDDGSRRGTITVPGGDTGHGKTFFAVWLTARYLEQGYKGVFCIRESRDSKIIDRVYENLRDKDKVENLIVADVQQGLGSLGDITSTIKYWNARCGIDFFVADHLRIIPVKGLNEWEENKRITTCVNRFMYLAQEVDAFGLPLSQVNRETLRGSRGWDKMPQLHNLYGSSAIEQAASMAISIFRPKEVEELHESYKDGELRAIKGPSYDDDRETYDKNSVFIRQIKNREGERYHKAVRFVHTDNGLVHKPGNQKKQEVPF